jgi:hypothetical protein
MHPCSDQENVDSALPRPFSRSSHSGVKRTSINFAMGVLWAADLAQTKPSVLLWMSLNNQANYIYNLSVNIKYLWPSFLTNEYSELSETSNASFIPLMTFCDTERPSFARRAGGPGSIPMQTGSTDSREIFVLSISHYNLKLGQDKSLHSFSLIHAS